MFEMTLLPSGISEKLEAVEPRLSEAAESEDARDDLMEELGAIVQSFEAYDNAGLDVDEELQKARQAYDALDNIWFRQDSPEKRSELASEAKKHASEISVANLTNSGVNEALRKAQTEEDVAAAREAMDMVDESGGLDR